MDLFAYSLTTQLSSFGNWRSDPEAIATDVFTVTWTCRSKRRMPIHRGAWWKGFSPKLTTGSGSDRGGASMENTAMVPDYTGNMQRLPTTIISSGKESNPTNSSTINGRCGPPTTCSCVEYSQGTIQRATTLGESYRAHTHIMEKEILQGIS